MRALALVLALSLYVSSGAFAADPAKTAQSSVEFAKKIVLAVKAAKDKTGQAPTTVTVIVDGKPIEVKVQVTSLAEGFSISAQPTIESKGSSPMQNANIDANIDGPSGPTLVSLVGTAADDSDVVAFATTGTELSVTVSNNDKSYTANTTTSVSDIAAQEPGKTTTLTAPVEPTQTSTTPEAITLAPAIETKTESDSDQDAVVIAETDGIAIRSLQRHGDGVSIVSTDARIPSDFGANGSVSQEGNFPDGASPSQVTVSPEQ
ncbi:MAG: hypothetical protein H0V44_12535 [Planctomycetes bacterium]|nr:hypothetical protein [Planctomycetota bacterium]